MAKDLDNLYREILSAAAGEITFDNVLESVTDYFGAGGGIIFEMDRTTGQILDWTTPTLVIGDDGYSDHINSINPRMRFSLRHAPGHVVYEGRFISEAGIDRHEFYDWLKGFAQFRYMLGSRIYDDGERSLFHSVEFSRQSGHPDKDKIEKFSRLSNAVGDAWRLHKRLEKAADPALVAAWTPDHLPWAAYALGTTGRVVGMNRRGRDLLDARTVLRLSDDNLDTLNRDGHSSFRRALTLGLSGVTAEALLIPSEGLSKLIAQVVPVNPDGRGGAVPVAAIVYVWNPIAQNRNVGQALQRLFGFTKAEQELAGVLASGADLAGAGDQLGLSRNTVRNRLQSMYAKTGTNRQNEFLLLVLGLMET